ncbi:RDD family protein [Collimonas pratensis]|uniref:RDD family protein n=1 Tax=Collimonas pratensis TaxID=279113 RepID=UPI00078145D0|nr:RDD family protein [Collimonas pratensis]
MKKIPGTLAPNEHRIIAYIIDILAAGLLAVFAESLIQTVSPIDAQAYAGLIALLYLLFKDAFDGQSFGARVVRMKVVTMSDGHPCSWLRSPIRNIFLIFGLIDAAFALGKAHRRLGDLVAGTHVINT